MLEQWKTCQWIIHWILMNSIIRDWINNPVLGPTCHSWFFQLLSYLSKDIDFLSIPTLDFPCNSVIVIHTSSNNCIIHCLSMTVFTLIQWNLIHLTDFNSLHNNINFTLECEKDKQISFVDVLLTRRSGGSFKRAIHRKATWYNQYLHFSSFIPMRMKRNLIHCLTGRAMKICTDDAINDELKFLRNLFIANGYPEHFVDKNMKLSRKSKSEFGPTKKNVYLSLPFKGDIQDEILTKRLTHAVKNTFHAGTIRLHFTF